MTSNEQEQATNSSKQNDIFSLKFKYFYSENTKNEKLSYLRRKKWKILVNTYHTKIGIK